METTLDPEKQKQAKEYARISRRLWAVDTVLNFVYTLAWLAFGWTILLRDWFLSNARIFGAAKWFDPANVFIPLLFALIFGGILAVLMSPLAYYSGFVLPHRYGMSNQSFKDWVVDGLKGMTVGAPIGLIVLEVLYAFLRAFPETWWLWAAGFLLVFEVLLANLAPILIMPIFNKFVPLGDEHADLAQRLIKLAGRANTKVRGVFKFDMSKRTKAANAALTGIGNTRRIILGDTLLNEFTPDEIETVLAHELGHHVNKDIPLGIMVGASSTLLSLYLASLGLNWAIGYFGFVGPADPAALPALMLILMLYGLITMPLKHAFSRWRERLADRYSLQATNQPEAFASAMTRLANQNLAEVDPEKWVVFLFYSHPPLEERIARARMEDERTSRRFKLRNT
jgi:STE24 endopeptidase